MSPEAETKERVAFVLQSVVGSCNWMSHKLNDVEIPVTPNPAIDAVDKMRELASSAITELRSSPISKLQSASSKPSETKSVIHSFLLN